MLAPPPRRLPLHAALNHREWESVSYKSDQVLTLANKHDCTDAVAQVTFPSSGLVYTRARGLQGKRYLIEDPRGVRLEMRHRLPSEAFEGRVTRQDLFLGRSMSMSSSPGGYGFSQGRWGPVFSPHQIQRKGRSCQAAAGEQVGGPGWPGH